MAWFSILTHVHLASLWRRWAISGFVILGIALGTALATAVSYQYVLTGRPFAALKQAAAGYGAVELSPSVQGRLPEGVLWAAQDTPGVTAAVPVVAQLTTAASTKATRGVLVVGTTCDAEAFLGRYGCADETRRFRARFGDGPYGWEPIWVGEPLARALHVHPGDPIGVAGGQVGDARVVGVLPARGVTGTLNSGYFAVGAASSAQTLLHTGAYYSAVYVKGPPAVRGRLQKALPPTVTVGKPSAPTRLFLELTRTLLFSVSILVLLAAVLIAGTSFMLGLDGRRIVFATLLVLGQRRRHLVRNLAIEGVVLGAIGGAVAVYPAYKAGVWIGGPFHGLLAGSGAEVVTRFEPWLGAAAIATGIVCGLAAACWAAVAAVRNADTLVLRDQNALAPTQAAPPAWLAVPGVALTLFGLVVGRWWGSGQVDFLPGIAGNLAVVGGVTLMICGLTPPAISGIEWVFTRWRSAGLLSAADLSRSPTRWTVLAVIVGITTFIFAGIGSLRVLTIESMARDVETEIGPAIYVHPRNVGDQSDDRFSPAAVNRIATLPGIAAVSPQYLAVVQRHGRGLNVTGTDPAHPRQNLVFAGRTASAVWAEIADPQLKSVIVSEMLATREHLHTGSEIVLPTADRGNVAFRVAAVAHVRFGQDNGIGDLAVTSTATARDMFAAGIDSLIVHTTPDAHTDTVIGGIERSAIVRISATDHARTFAEALRNGNRFLGPIQTVGWAMAVTAALAVSVFLCLSLIQRKRMIAVLRVIGYRTTTEFLTMLYEGLAVGAVGAAAGVAGAIVFSLFMSEASPALLGHQLRWHPLTAMFVVPCAVAVAASVLGAVAAPLWRLGETRRLERLLATD